jgi:hypothetical protein
MQNLKFRFIFDKPLKRVFDIKISTDDKGLSKELFALQNRLFENRQVRSLGTDPETGVMHYEVASPFRKYFGNGYIDQGLIV